MDLLVGGVRAADLRAERDHVQSLHPTTEQAALETGVDRGDLRLLLPDLGVDAANDIQHRRVEVRLPAGILIGDSRFEAGQRAGRPDRVDDGVQTRGDAAPSAADDADLVADTHGGDVVRGLDEAADVGAHRQHAVGQDHQQLQQLVALLPRHGPPVMLRGVQLDLQLLAGVA